VPANFKQELQPQKLVPGVLLQHFDPPAVPAPEPEPPPPPPWILLCGAPEPAFALGFCDGNKLLSAHNAEDAGDFAPGFGAVFVAGSPRVVLCDWNHK